MDQLTVELSNVMQKLFLGGMVLGALIRLTDGRREHVVERFALFIMACGAFFQLAKTAHPSGTGLDVLVTNAGVSLWFLSQAWAYYVKKIQEL